MAILTPFTLASLIALCVSAVFVYRLRHSWHLHLRCIRLCRRIADELSRKQEPGLVTDRVFRAIVQHTNADIGVLSFYSERDDSLHIVRVYGLPDNSLKPGTVLDTSTGFGYLTENLKQGPVILHQGLREALWTNAGIRLSSRQNMICIPVSGPSDIQGLLQLVSGPHHSFTKYHLNDLAGVGFYLGAAIHNARLIDTIRRQRDAAEILNDIGLNISRYLDLDEIIAYAVEQGHRLMQSRLTWFLECSDEDRGATPDDLDKGQGITTMRNRAARLGRTLTVAPCIGNGFDVTLEFPSYA